MNLHYTGIIITTTKKINDAYKVAFLEQPNFQNIDSKELFGMDKLKHNINSAKTLYRDFLET